MDRRAKFRGAPKAMQTICVGGVFIIEKRVGYDRRLKRHKGIKKYERRLSNWEKNFKRRRPFVNIII